MNIASLPSRLGVGTLASTDKFVDFLVKAKQSYWQLSSIHPACDVHGNCSPYSAFAGNTLLIDANQLVADSLITQQLLESCSHCVGIDYDYAKSNNYKILTSAYQQFVKDNPPREYFCFVDDNQFWLDDYCLFCALREHFGNVPWSQWNDSDIRMRNIGAINYYSELLADRIDYHRFCQYIFYKQWAKLRDKLTANNIMLIGDMPMYVSYDSADVWAHSGDFDLTTDNKPRFVLPPAIYCGSGAKQIGATPIFNWKNMKANSYLWWTKRIEHYSKLFDIIHLDNFGDFISFSTVLYGDSKLRLFKRKNAYGQALLQLLFDDNSNLCMTCGYLGQDSSKVIKLAKKFNIADTRALQLAFDGDANNICLPTNYIENCVACIAEPNGCAVVDWWHSIDKLKRDRVLSLCMSANDTDIRWQLIDLLNRSSADTVIVSMQDISASTNIDSSAGAKMHCANYMASNSHFSNENAKKLVNIAIKNNRVLI